MYTVNCVLQLHIDHINRISVITARTPFMCLVVCWFRNETDLKWLTDSAMMLKMGLTLPEESVLIKTQSQLCLNV